MGITAENVATKFQVTRDQQDDFALKSQEKASKALKENKFKDEIVNFKIKSKKAEIDFNIDEHPRVGLNSDALKRLKPVFKKDGTVTAGNAFYSKRLLLLLLIFLGFNNNYLFISPNLVRF